MLFTEEAVRLIDQHTQEAADDEVNSVETMHLQCVGACVDPHICLQGMFMYLAYQNVHSASSKDPPLQAPCTTVDDLYSTTELDLYKVMGAMITELDYGVSNVTAALQQSG